MIRSIHSSHSIDSLESFNRFTRVKVYDLTFWDKDETENVICQKLLSDKLSADLGYVYENVVAQMLKASGNELFYHAWPTPSGKLDL